MHHQIINVAHAVVVHHSVMQHTNFFFHSHKYMQSRILSLCAAHTKRAKKEKNKKKNFHLLMVISAYNKRNHLMMTLMIHKHRSDRCGCVCLSFFCATILLVGINRANPYFQFFFCRSKLTNLNVLDGKRHS